MDGIIVLNKPAGLTSFSCVNKLKHILNEKKIGHTGTLDEMVEGVLVICIGKATKLVELLMDHKKIYEATALIGKKTSTGDLYGEVLCTKKEIINEKELDEVLNCFLGEYMQIPPMYSALKQNGVRLSDLARKGKMVERNPRKMHIYSIKRTSNITNDGDFSYFNMTIEGSKGLYIRTLCEDIADKLNMPGCMAKLRRIQVGDFSIDDSYTIEEITNNKYQLITITSVLEKFPKLVVKDYLIKLIYNGITLDERQIMTDKPFVCYSETGKMLALYHPVSENQYKPVIILGE